MLLTNGDKKIIDEISCSENECKRRSECLIVHPAVDNGRTGTFYPKLEILFYGKFVISCDHFLKGGVK